MLGGPEKQCFLTCAEYVRRIRGYFIAVTEIKVE